MTLRSFKSFTQYLNIHVLNNNTCPSRGKYAREQIKKTNLHEAVIYLTIHLKTTLLELSVQ